MIVNRKRIEKLIEQFMKDHNLQEFTLQELRIVNDYNVNDNAIATIQMNQITKRFYIRIYEKEFETYREVMAAVIHELTHLYLYEVSEFYDYLQANSSPPHVQTHLINMYETITCKVAKIFEKHYLEGL